MPSGCVEWRGSADRYGHVRHEGRIRLVHRVAHEIHIGPVNGLAVCHSCDNPLCINPEHLFLGTNADNSADMVRKGRQARMGGNAAAKLTIEAAREIRRLRGQRMTRQEIASRFGVSVSAVKDVLAGRYWKAA
jgi:hypothetical protein